jgi:probable rRNA maturation factor
LTSFSLDEKFFKKVAQKVLTNEKKGKGNLSVAFVTKDRIRQLNNRYLNKDKVTDVLAFPEKEDFYKKYKLKKFPKVDILGEIIICPFKVKQNAKKFNSSFKKELSLVLIHGALHLLGYDHEGSIKEAKKMKEKEGYYLKYFIKSGEKNRK